MLRFISLLLTAALFISATGCASLQTPAPSPFAGLPFRHAAFDFKTGWKVAHSPQGLAVEGVLKNVKYLRVDDLEVDVTLRRGETTVAKGAAFVPGSIDRDDYGSFSILLKNATALPGDTLNFSIRYRGTEGSISVFTWLSEFSADALTGAVIRKGSGSSPEE